MRKWFKYFFIIFLLSVFSTASFAQKDKEFMMDKSDSMQGMGQNPTEVQALMKSAEAMMSMCNMMMKKEMAMWPWIMTASVIFGILLFIALLFFVILEFLWIRFWIKKLKNE